MTPQGLDLIWRGVLPVTMSVEALSVAIALAQHVTTGKFRFSRQEVDVVVSPIEKGMYGLLDLLEEGTFEYKGACLWGFSQDVLRRAGLLAEGQGKLNLGGSEDLAEVAEEVANRAFGPPS